MTRKATPMQTKPSSAIRATAAAVHGSSISNQYPGPLTAALTSRSPEGRALVLGGGGSTGNAWLIGVVAGLFDAGLDVAKADLIIGTSAGATAAAQIVAASPRDLFAATLAPIPGAQRRPRGNGPGSGQTGAVVDHLTRMNRIVAGSSDATDMRRRVAKAALELDADSDDSWSGQWRSTVAARLPQQDWPEQEVLITAVDARSGEAVVFDRRSGVALVDAVAASCSSGRPYRIGDDRFIDGGFRSNAENADLAAGYGRVLVLSPFSGRSLQPVEWGMHLGTQADALRAGGSTVETIFPNAENDHMFGADAMNIALRPAAAQAGYEQAGLLAGRLIDLWG